MPIRLVLWDVDHTLVELQRLHYTAYEKAFRMAFNRDGGPAPDMTGRADRSSSTHYLTSNGVEPSEENLKIFWEALVTAYHQLASDLTKIGHATEGAAEALETVAKHAQVAQSILTGNIRILAERKIRECGLDRHINFDIGGYGEDHKDRTELVHAACHRASTKLGQPITPAQTLLIGDTELDIRAARESGAKILAIATGAFTTHELAAAGADAVLPDLTNTARIIKIIESLSELPNKSRLENGNPGSMQAEATGVFEN